jgi:predicted Zn-dependent protease
LALNSAGSRGLSLRHLFAIISLAAATAVNAAAQGDLAAQLKQAAGYHESADYRHSIPLLKRIVQQSPHNYLANLLLGEDLLHSGNVQEAIAPLKVASRVRPQDATAEVYLADAVASSGDFVLASESLQAGMLRSGASEQFLEAWASYCLERYRLVGLGLRTTKRGEAVALRVEAASHPEGSEARESLLVESATANPDQPGIWGELGISQLELGKRAEVLESLKAAQQREPQAIESLQFEALLAAAEHNWPQAQERLVTIGARSPAEFKSALELWRHVLAPGAQSGGSLGDCLRNPAGPCPLAEKQPQGGNSLSAKELYAQGRWEQLMMLPKPTTDDRPQWLWLGVALAKTGKCPQAIPSLERGVKADEWVAGFWLEMCYSSEAERTAVRLKAESDQGAAHQLQGDVLLRLRGDAAGALAQYQEALKSRSKDPRLHERLAEAYTRLGDVKHARSAALAALAIDPHRSAALRILGSLAMNNRDYDQALPWLRRLVQEEPADRSVHVELAKALAQTGNAAEALQQLAPALAAGYPDEKGALHALEARVLRELGRDDEAAKAAAEARRLSDAAQALETNGERVSPNANQ